MFTIVISEKGGAERRETFERPEISVGRVQGNDLMLPKGNVSKHHARLLLRDGRFIVTDLRSTNGTYVNGRKISQATIVREGDKIYVGDFVLRVESGQGASAEGARDPVTGPVTGSQLAAPVSPSSASIPAESPSQGGPASPGASVPSTPVGPAATPDIHNVSHFPLERDPDSESAPELRGVAMPSVPGPPRVPQTLDPRPRALSTSNERAVDRERPPVAPPVARVGGVMLGTIPVVRAVVSSQPLREAPHQAARRLALIALVDRVFDALDLSSLDRVPDVSEALLEQIDRVAGEQARAMRAEGEAPEGIDMELLARDATRELAGLGPLGVLLDDDQAIAIHVARPDYVVVTRQGQPHALAEPGFSSPEALARVLARLAHQAGEPLASGEAVVERRLARGARMTAIGPPVSRAWSLTIRKARKVEASLDDLARSSAMSRSMATFLDACVAARANVLLVGADPAVSAPILGALLAATPPGEQIALLQDRDEIALSLPQVIPLTSGQGFDSSLLLAGAARLVSGRLALSSLQGGVVGPLIDVIAGGVNGVIAGIGAPSLRQGLGRLVALVSLGRPGASIEAAREAVAESFDVAVEVGWASGEGRVRVLRIAELAGADPKGVVTRDLFASNADPSGEPAFVVTGTTPRLAHEFAARGVRLDPNLFRRAR
jgi:pilus assembly protein CpaF